MIGYDNMNEKGFAATGILYTILVVFILIMFSMLSLLYSRNNLLNKIQVEVEGEISSSNDLVSPVVVVEVSQMVATFTITDNVGVVAYGVNDSIEVEPTYTQIESTTSTELTWTAQTSGDYVVWIRDVGGNVVNVMFTIE